ncbi:MAG: hypothetical protein AAEJ52_01750, partial [Myxococcota bacterium]
MLDLVLTGKLGIAVGCGVLALIALRSGWLFALDPRRFDALALAALFASRFGLFALLYLVMGYTVQSDVPIWYYPQGLAALEGKVVYRDFASSYGPLFPYLIAGILSVWHSLLAIVLVAILVEWVALPIWLRVGRRWLSESETRIAAVLYILNPTVLLTSAMNGQNQVWVALCLAFSFLLVGRRDVLSGAWLAASLIAVKALGALFAPVLWLFASRRTRWFAGFVLPLGLAAALSAVFQVDLLAPLRFEGRSFSGGNLPYLFTLFGLELMNPTTSVVANGVLLAALAFAFLSAWSRGVHREPRNVIHLLAVVFLVFMLFSKKSFSNYLGLAAFPLFASVAMRPLGLGMIAFC